MVGERFIKLKQKKKILLFFLWWLRIDVYCQGVQLIGDDKNLNDYEIENEDNLVIIPKVRLPTELAMAAAAGKIF